MAPGRRRGAGAGAGGSADACLRRDETRAAVHRRGGRPGGRGWCPCAARPGAGPALLADECRRLPRRGGGSRRPTWPDSVPSRELAPSSAPPPCAGVTALRRVPRTAVTQARSYRILVPGALVTLALLTGLVLVVAGGILLGAVPVTAGRGGAGLPAVGLSLVSLAVIGVFARTVF